MAKINEKVRDAVADALAKNPKASVDELFALAKGISPSIGKLSKRQFHAQYPLQIKRKKTAGAAKRRRRAAARKAAAPAPRRGRKPAADAATRDAVRAVFLSFASDLAAAEARKDVVRVVANVDSYVDKAMKAAGA